MTCYCVFSSDLHSCRWRQKDDDEQYFYYVELHDWSRSCILPTLEVFLCFCLDRYFLWTARIDPICIAGAYPVFSSAYVFHVRVRVRVLVSTVCSPSWYKLFFWNDFDLFRMPAFLNIHTDSWCWLLRQYSPPRPKLKSLCSCRMLDLAFWISYRGLLCREAQLAVPSSSLLTLTATGRVELHVCQRTNARVDREKITFSKLKNIFFGESDIAGERARRGPRYCSKCFSPSGFLLRSPQKIITHTIKIITSNYCQTCFQIIFKPQFKCNYVFKAFILVFFSSNF
jgi:hypothetical protein